MLETKHYAGEAEGNGLLTEAILKGPWKGERYEQTLEAPSQTLEEFESHFPLVCVHVREYVCACVRLCVFLNA